MISNVVYPLVALGALVGEGLAAHGDGAEGTVMGPVAFLWPSDRVWSAAYDNVGPCGSSSSVTNRTNFPLGSIGSIELTIADDAYNLAVRIAYGNDPTLQSDFQAVKSNDSELEPGHQCYSLPAEASTVAAGSNATIQLEYWADDSNKNETFYACADIQFVEAVLFTEQVMCFNVTASEFDASSSTTASTPSATATQATASASSSAPYTQHASHGLSSGAKAGIAVGSIVGGLALLAAVFLLFRRRSQVPKDTENIPRVVEKPIQSTDAASIGSADTAH